MTNARPAPPVPPWAVPVPVRPSQFVALYPRHAELNVETFLGAIGPFGETVRPLAQQDLLFCDLQDNPDSSVHGRLGSGRAGSYRGMHLKGVGRTLLTANWAVASDVVHHTGHMRTSSAIRELLVSTYLIAKGAGAAIVPCEGVLLKPMDPAARQHVAQLLRTEVPFDEDRPGPWSGDWQLQAISVKRAGFARFSNLVWLANHLDFYRLGDNRSTGLLRFVHIFLRRVDPALHADDATPEVLVQALLNATERGMATLRQFFRFGISWGSLHNNFCVDGRYLDLEWPVVLGRPLLGLIGTSPTEALQVPNRQMLWGLFEPYAFILHMRMLAWFFRGRFRAIAETGFPVTRLEREFSAGVVEAFDAVGEEHVLFSKSKLVESMVSWVAREHELGASAASALRGALETTYAANFTDLTGRAVLDLKPMPTTLMRTGLNKSAIPHLIAGIEPYPLVTEEAALVNRLVMELDEIGDRDLLLRALGEAVVTIREACRPAA